MRAFVVLFVLVAASGCPGKPELPDLPDGGLDGGPAGTTVGPEGGTIEGEGVVIEVPAGAVSSPTLITVTPSPQRGPDGRTVLGDVIAITPHGARFDVPVRVALPLPVTHAFAQLWTRADEPLAQWERLEDARVEDGRVLVEVDHFSYFALIDPGLSWELVFAGPESEQLLDLEVHDGLLYVLSDRTVRRSADGVTWFEIADGLPATDDTLRLRDLASTELGLLVATSRGVFALDGATWSDRSEGLPDNGLGQPVSVDAITSHVPENTFLVGAYLAGSEHVMFVRWWSPARNEWVLLAEIPGPRFAWGIAYPPGGLAIWRGGFSSFFSVSVPGGEVTEIMLFPPPQQVSVFTIAHVSYYGEVWVGTDRDIFRRSWSTPPDGPHEYLPTARDGAFLSVNAILELFGGVVLVGTEHGVFVTTDGETFGLASEGLPAFTDVRRLIALRGIPFTIVQDAIYRARFAELGCGLLGDACSADGDCCDGTCSGGACSTDACGADGASCRRSSGCCSGYCADGACRVQDPERCGTGGDACTTRRDCCRGDCVSGECVDLTHCRCDPEASCGSSDGCGGTCNGMCPDGLSCQQTASGGDFCGVPCADWHDCRRALPNDDTYCCVQVDGVGTCLDTDAACDTECASVGSLCGGLAGLGCCDPDPSDNEVPYCCPADLPDYASTCSCTMTVFP